jgi:hypothetical protein
MKSLPAKKTAKRSVRRTAAVSQDQEQIQVPRLPHERDESVDSQACATPPDPLIEKAAHDARLGHVDSDRGPVVDELYRRTLRSKKEPPERQG